MKYQLRPHTQMLDFLLKVEKCRDTVILETDEGDMLNLKSQLSKYIFLATGHTLQSLESCRIVCSKEDATLLDGYIIIPAK